MNPFVFLNMNLLHLILIHKLQMITPHATQTPVFWGHGTSDPLVRYNLGTESREFLTGTIGFKLTTNSTTGLEFRSYEGMAHSSCQTELDDLSAWLKRVIPKGSE
jgi:predicted esterase